MLSVLSRISFRGLLLVALGLIGAALVAIAITLSALRQDAVQDAVADTSNMATMLSEQTAHAVQAIDTATTAIAQYLSQHYASAGEAYDDFLASKATHRYLRERLERLPQTEVIAVVDNTGRHVNASRGWPIKPVDLSDRDYFSYARDNAGSALFVSDVMTNRVSGKPNIFFAKRISGPNGEFLGIVLAGVKLSFFHHIYDSLTSTRNQYFGLLRNDGLLLMRYPDVSNSRGQRLPPDSPWHDAVKAGGGVYQTAGTFDGISRLMAVRPLKDFPLVVNVGIPKQDALATWKHRAMTIGLGATLALVCALLLIYALWHQISQLAASKAKLVEREARLAEKTAELEEANRRIDTAINHMVQGLVMFNAAGEMVVCNDRFIELYRLPRNEVMPGITIRRVLELRTAAGTFFDDIEDYVEELRTKMKAGEPLIKLVELADGRTFCVTNQPTGGGAWVATHEDITERRRDERELQRTRNMLHAVVENIPETLIVKDAKTRKYVYLNRAGEALLGVSRADFIGKTGDDVFGADEAARIRARDETALRTGQFNVETRSIETVDGRRREVVSTRIAIQGRDEPEYIMSVIEDVTERRRDELELQRARNMFRAVVENIPEMLVVKDAKTGVYVFVNRAGEDIVGARKEDLIGKTTEEIFPKDQADIIVARDREALKLGQMKVDFHVTRTLDGKLRDVASKRIAIGGKGNEPEYLLTVIEDITERKRNESRIAHLAHHDPLTDLANRAALNMKLAETVEQAAAANGEFALLCIDLDRFKEVNDLYGHAAGDKVLLEIVRRMREVAGDTFLARLGGDEFMAICLEQPTRAAATALAERLVEVMNTDIDCDGRKVRMGMSIGVAVYPADGTDMAALLRNADAALYRAKAEGRSEIRFFEAEMDRVLHDRRALQADLALAVTRNELQLYFQPQARITGQIIGLEALLRWDHLRRGFVPPDMFIPLAEESGLIDQIGEWVLREACREAASWRKPLQIAINLSPLQLRQPDIVPFVHSVLLETGLAPDRLMLEITESALMDDYSRAVSILRRLKALGIRIAMDDFGTGYSSLSYLQSFPFDKIKIDQTFVANLERSAQSAAIVRTVISLGRSLNLTTVAEGVETQAQLEILRREGCDEMQGYLIGRPQPIADYADLVGRQPHERRSAAAG
ncbi:MAG: bifunctional diguanylate cyclase/phosphodiesterase [Pseudomonadota bacterium]